MKKLLTFTLAVASLSSFAFIYRAGDMSKMSCSREFRDEGGAAQTLACLVTTTTSLPTMIVEGQEMDLNSDEASIRLVTEAHGDAEEQVSSRIAADAGVSVEAVMDTVKSMEAQGMEVSVKAVLTALAH